VREDRDGWLRMYDGRREGWARKSDFVLSRDAPAYFTDRIRANPADSFALIMRGQGWLDRGEYDNAIKDFTECIRIDGNDADAFAVAGRRMTRRIDLQQGRARRHATEVFDDDPRDDAGDARPEPRRRRSRSRRAHRSPRLRFPAESTGRA